MIFDFTVEEANGIIFALSKLPYDQSAGLIHKMQEQAKTQIEPEVAQEPNLAQAEPKKKTTSKA